MAIETKTTEVERNWKHLFCIRTLRAVKNDLGYMSLDEPIRDMIEEALTPIGGWEAGFARINAFMEGDTEDDV